MTTGPLVQWPEPRPFLVTVATQWCTSSHSLTFPSLIKMVHGKFRRTFIIGCGCTAFIKVPALVKIECTTH